MLTISLAADLIGVSISTLRRWDREGKLCPKRTIGGHRRYSKEQLGDWLSDSEIIDTGSITATRMGHPYIYARVSTGRQMTDGNLDRQADRLERYTKRKFGRFCKYTLIKEYGSGLNTNRLGLQRLIKAVKNGQASAVICAYPDRLSRFGTQFLEILLDVFHVPLIIAEKSKDVPLEEQLMNDIMSLMACFSGRLYKSRAMKATAGERLVQKEGRWVQKCVNQAIDQAWVGVVDQLPVAIR